MLLGFGLLRRSTSCILCRSTERQKLERLCRYITRPAVSNERLRLDTRGHIVCKLKTPYRDGTTHLIFTPLELLQRLTALIPRPRINLIRYHGILAPNARGREQVIPTNPANPNKPPTQEPQAHEKSSYRQSWAKLLKRVFVIDVSHCPVCGGSMKIIAAITDPCGIHKIQTHLGLSFAL